MATRRNPVTPMLRIQRSREVARLRSADPPVPWPDVAEQTGLSQSTCKRLLKQLETFGDVDAVKSPMEYIEQRSHELRVIMDEASATYAAAPEGSAVRVGALKIINEASADIFELAARAGFVPRYLGAVSFERKLQDAFRAMGHVLRTYEASPEMLDALLELAERQLGHDPNVIEARAS